MAGKDEGNAGGDQDINGGKGRRILHDSSAQTYQAGKRRVSRRIRDEFLRAGRLEVGAGAGQVRDGDVHLNPFSSSQTQHGLCAKKLFNPLYQSHFAARVRA